MKTLENKLLLQKKHDRKYNLLFYSIQNEQDEDTTDKLNNLIMQWHYYKLRIFLLSQVHLVVFIYNYTFIDRYL